MAGRFSFEPAPLEGLCVVTRQRLGDARGYLSRLFEPEALREAGWPGSIAQINETATALKGTVRGLHFQHPPFAEAKLVFCTRGRIFDVAVDLRTGSPTFLHWHGVELSDENGRALLIPPGFAHGFQALCDDVRMIYLHSAPYTPEAEGGFDACDPALGIQWPLAVENRSDRDRSFAPIDAGFEGIRL